MQLAFNTTKHFFDILVEKGSVSDFQTLMGDYRADRAELLDVYPADERLVQGFEPLSGDAILFVDVGGGRGHEIEKFQAKYPQQKVHMILQDLPNVVEEAKDSTTMEVMPYDFFTPQPVQGVPYKHAASHQCIVLIVC